MPDRCGGLCALYAPVWQPSRVAGQHRSTMKVLRDLCGRVVTESDERRDSCPRPCLSGDPSADLAGEKVQEHEGEYVSCGKALPERAAQKRRASGRRSQDRRCVIAQRICRHDVMVAGACAMSVQCDRPFMAGGSAFRHHSPASVFMHHVVCKECAAGVKMRASRTKKARRGGPFAFHPELSGLIPARCAPCIRQ